MNLRNANIRIIGSVLMSACMLSSASALAGSPVDASPFAGTWTLVAADVQHPDGSRASDFGAHPKGLLLVDKQGRYSLQIFKAERPAFHAGDKAHGTPDEYESAVMGSSTHYGTLSVDTDQHVIVFHIQGASYPNWEGQDQQRSYELKGQTLSYRVAPRPNGDVPISVWQRVE